MQETELEVTRKELWAIQGLVKALTVEGNSTNAVPGTVEVDDLRVPAPLTLRRKVNSALLSIADMDEKDVLLNLTAEELWVIDGVMNREMYDGAEVFLLKVFRALEGLSLGIPLLTKEQAKQAYGDSNLSLVG